MKRVLSGIALAALLALAIPGTAQAHWYRHHHPRASAWWCCCCCYYPVRHHHHWWRHHGWRHHGWHWRYGWSEPYDAGTVHAATDFMADRLNRGQAG